MLVGHVAARGRGYPPTRIDEIDEVPPIVVTVGTPWLTPRLSAIVC